MLENSIKDENTLRNILELATNLMSTLNKTVGKHTYLDNFLYNEEIPYTDYYLIYNRYVTFGKKIIDKRVAREVTRQEIIDELDLNLNGGLQLDFILIPKNLELEFGLYIEDSIYYIDHKYKYDNKTIALPHSK